MPAAETSEDVYEAAAEERAEAPPAVGVAAAGTRWVLTSEGRAEN